MLALTMLALVRSLTTTLRKSGKTPERTSLVAISKVFLRPWLASLARYSGPYLAALRPDPVELTALETATEQISMWLASWSNASLDSSLETISRSTSLIQSELMTSLSKSATAPIAWLVCTSVLPTAKLPTGVGYATLKRCHETESQSEHFPIAYKKPDFHSGGGGLFGSVESYLKVIQVLLNKGKGANGAQILKPETVATMFEDHVPAKAAQDLHLPIPDARPDLTVRLESLTAVQPGAKIGWGLT